MPTLTSDSLTVMTTRQRWYALHRARRVFLHSQGERLTELMAFGSTMQLVTTEGPAAEYIKHAMDMLCNPPMIVDSLLKVDGFRPQRRRLP
jgi:hypothetical protein